MPAEAVTITPHDARRTAFRAIVAALQADASLELYVAVWDVRDGTDLSTVTLGVGEHAVRLTPVFEREEVLCCNGGGSRTWECPVTVQVEARVASANVDNAINLAGLVEAAAAGLSLATLRAAGVSWLDLVQPAAQAGEYATHAGAFRFVVHIER